MNAEGGKLKRGRSMEKGRGSCEDEKGNLGEMLLSKFEPGNGRKMEGY